MVDVSIIIVSYNTKKLTLQSIKSVIEEGSDLEKEIIVVDNGSSDGSKETIEKYLRKLANGAEKTLKKEAEREPDISENSRDIHTRLITNRTNLGFAKANNQGIKKASGKYIFLLNSDAKVKENSIKELVAFAGKNKDAGVVAPRLLNPDGSAQESVFRFPTTGRAVRQYWLGEKGLLDKYAPKSKKAVAVDAVVGAAFLITPEARKRAGLLNDSYFMFFEDLDYCRSVWKSGLKVYYLPETEVVHYHGASGRDVVDDADQWRRLVPSSKIYHGILKHYLFNFIIWTGQKWQKLTKKQN